MAADPKDYAGYALAAVIAVVAWFTRRDVTRYDEGLVRIGELEAETVTHDQLDALLSKMSAERAALHTENKQLLERIVDKIDANELRRSNTEHSIRDNVNRANLRIAVLAAKSGVTLPEDAV